MALEARGVHRPGRRSLLWWPPDSGRQRLARWLVALPFWRFSRPASPASWTGCADGRCSPSSRSAIGTPGRGRHRCATCPGAARRGGGRDRRAVRGGQDDARPGGLGACAAGDRWHAARTVRLDGVDVAGRAMHEVAAQVAIGFQNPATQLSGVTETVFEEVAFGPMNLGVPRDEVIARTWDGAGDPAASSHSRSATRRGFRVDSSSLSPSPASSPCDPAISSWTSPRPSSTRRARRSWPTHWPRSRAAARASASLSRRPISSPASRTGSLWSTAAASRSRAGAPRCWPTTASASSGLPEPAAVRLTRLAIGAGLADDAAQRLERAIRSAEAPDR